MRYTIVFGLTYLKISDYFTFSRVCFTRAHPYKLFVPMQFYFILFYYFITNTRK